jgi:hypothetical protein
MSEYVKQAKDFLASCNATMKITFLGKDTNRMWGESILRNTYRATIKTPLGTMWVKFWDSLNNTKNRKEPTEYDILACLQKYDVGSFENFISEFGYETEEPEDMRRVKRIYEAVCNEYEKVCRCFTEEQIEVMWEIN